MKIRAGLWALIVLAVLARLMLAIGAGNAPETRETGGSDTVAYQLLGDNLTHHRGLTYAGMPTAIRPPLYPLVLSAAQIIAPRAYRSVVRLLQFFAGIAMALVCAGAAKKLGGSALAALAAALAAPTLVFFSAELITETFAALIVAVFLYALIVDASPWLAGAIIGVGMLERFNLAALAVAYLMHQFAPKKFGPALRYVSAAGVVAVLFTAPWFARNLIVFNGHALYSTQTGMNLLAGVVVPQGRGQPGDAEKFASKSGFLLADDIETNSPIRLQFPAEPVLDAQAGRAGVSELLRANWLSLAWQKLSAFWLGLDQILSMQNFGLAARLVRATGVAIYWLLLAAAIYGWKKLRVRNPRIASAFLIYVVTVTVLHLPFVMNTRLRAPLIEPALCILAGVAFSAGGNAESGANRDAEESSESLAVRS